MSSSSRTSCTARVHPGQDAMKCVLPAIHAVTEKGFIDEKRIGDSGPFMGG